MTRYSHRNGETEPLTIEGWYAMQHPQAWNWQGSTFVFVERNMDGIDVYCTGQDDPIGYDQMDSRIRWYGPIVAPWEQPAIPTDVRETLREALDVDRKILERRAHTVERHGVAGTRYREHIAAIDAALAWLDAQEPTDE